MLNSQTNEEINIGFSHIAGLSISKESCGELTLKKPFESRLIDKKREQKLIARTIDRHIMPLFCVFYFIDFLDRTNIGNASLGGIKNDLNLTSEQLSLAISAFFITYLIFEVPSNIALKRTTATFWLSFIMLVWGIVTLCMAFTKNFQSLLVCRLLLGAAESGYVPGILYVLSKLYRPDEFSKRVAVLLCMTALSGVVSGPIAYGTSFLEGRKGLHGWQYLFIIEGVPTICLGIISYIFLFDNIEQVSWLTDDQKAIHKSHIQIPEAHIHVDVRTIIKAILDWKTIMFSLCYFLCGINLISFQIFTPIIVNGFGFSVLNSQLLSAPPSVMLAAATYLGGYLTDKHKNKRGIIIAIGFLVTAIGFMLLRILEDRWAKYGSLFVIPFGVGVQFAANVGWSAINFPILDIRAVAVAIIIMFGSGGGVLLPV
ncbi:hypothetical protein G6F57_011692 [Rhizopus arrhizus]|uniref:Major facilitator superfamily (MFS) profile domain-containing protein n=1 Tax=Rhizopus oryzae TaxID=64495 RepID=A0A9P6WZR5_RHIOR|nr:hypothetical protein G6F23_008831 [Rhizopus arrhizus]KAG1398104.1 hypothetical protein G6F58_011394 [Rhizopus delemar]KAG0755985.1 hypothetical protein G6F24_011458 [Rhizopus arrhizus]KAG0778569.1 hypothetical protein G6F22_011158 [Rhizopus arrhizus]KAG0795920.1 hypothetical protein G6F21_001717 [Rhizopus arrhizus]